MTNRDRRVSMPLDDVALEAALFDLSVAIVVPPAPDVAAAVGARLRASVTERRPLAAPWFRIRWALLAALLGLLLLAAIAAATGFGLPGLRILFAEPTASPSASAAPPASVAPPASPSPSGAPSASAPRASAAPPAPSGAPSASAPRASAALAASPASPVASATVSTPSATASATSAAPSSAPTLPAASLGLPTTLDAARATVAFRLFVPDAVVVDQVVPSVYLDPSVREGQVALIYAATAAMPASSTSPVGPSGRRTALLITESSGGFNEAFLQKTLGPNATVTPVDVGGARGFWISGEPHEILVIDAFGETRPETLRGVGDVLVLVRDGTLIRIESGLGLERTLQVARSMG